MKRSVSVLSVLVLAVLASVAAVPAHATGPYCGIRWGSLPERVPAASTGEVFDVRAGRHRCFDRLVLDVSGDVNGYVVRYVDHVRMDGSGQVVPVRGGARLQITATAPASLSDSMFRADAKLVSTAGYRTFRHIAWAGSFEGHTTLGLGVRARLPFRVFLLDGPGAGSRLVLDVAHQW
jgi:hypothetical protein